jgi:hypothetical protein
LRSFFFELIFGESLPFPSNFGFCETAVEVAELAARAGEAVADLDVPDTVVLDLAAAELAAGAGKAAAGLVDTDTVARAGVLETGGNEIVFGFESPAGVVSPVL